MKKNKAFTKLGFNKATISNLEQMDMDNLKGGLSTMPCTLCYSCSPEKCFVEKTLSECVCTPTA